MVVPGIVGRLDQDALAARRTVRPGMTGLWQISGRSDTDMVEMALLDTAYLCRRSIGFDLEILVRTPQVVVRGHGAH